MSHSSKYDDSRHRSSSSRRDRSESRRDRDSSSRRSSPGNSRARSPPPKPRDDNELPQEFGRSGPIIDEDETTVLKRMSSAFTITPLNALAEHLKDEHKIIKVWTRNYREVRGISKGALVAFDKHWNIILSNVEDSYIKPKKTKTPYLLDAKIGDTFAEIPPKVPKVKKEKKVPADENVETEKPEPTKEMSEKKKKRKEKKAQRPFYNRELPILFIRGDNIVMIAIIIGKDETSAETMLLKR